MLYKDHAINTHHKLQNKKELLNLAPCGKAGDFSHIQMYSKIKPNSAQYRMHSNIEAGFLMFNAFNLPELSPVVSIIFLDDDNGGDTKRTRDHIENIVQIGMKNKKVVPSPTSQLICRLYVPVSF